MFPRLYSKSGFLHGADIDQGKWNRFYYNLDRLTLDTRGGGGGIYKTRKKENEGSARRPRVFCRWIAIRMQAGFQFCHVSGPWFLGHVQISCGGSDPAEPPAFLLNWPCCGDMYMQISCIVFWCAWREPVYVLKGLFWSSWRWRSRWKKNHGHENGLRAGIACFPRVCCVSQKYLIYLEHNEWECWGHQPLRVCTVGPEPRKTQFLTGRREIG